MSDVKLATRDEVERFKAYIEMAKYAISICIALAALSGLFAKAGAPKAVMPSWVVLVFWSGIFLNIAVFLISHRLVSEATMGITHKLTEQDREDLLEKINRGSYSLFVIVFIANLIFWSIAIGIIGVR